MFSRAQQITLKRAQKEAGVADEEYRDTLEMLAGCRSSTSPALADRHLDKLLAYFETIYWRGIDAGTLQPSGSLTAIFRQRGYWADKNTNEETSRDRFNGNNSARDVADLERRLTVMGFGGRYLATIRQKVTKGRADAHALHLYRAALERTLKAKTKLAVAGEQPF